MFGGKVSSGPGKTSSRPASGLGALPASSEISLAVRPFHSFGVRGPLRDNVEWLSESRLIFPVGQRVATLLVEKREMAYVDLHPTVDRVVSMSIAPNRKRVAFCELAVPDAGHPGHHKSGKGGAAKDSAGASGAAARSHSSVSPRDIPAGLVGQVSVYHAIQGVHLRTLTYPNMEGHFAGSAFTADNKFLVAIGSAPEFNLVYWKWSNMKTISSTQMHSAATRVRVNPANPAQVTTSGPHHLRLWTLEKDLTLKCSTLLPQKREKAENFVDHAWTKGGKGSGGNADDLGSSNFLIAVTEKGHVFVLQLNEAGTAEVRQTINLFGGHGGGGHHHHHHQHIHTLQISDKGFVVGGSNGYFAVYEQTDDLKDPFLPIRSFVTGEHDHVTSLAVSPLGEQVCSFVRPSNQLIMFPLAGIDMIDQDERTPFAPLTLNGFHAGAVTSMSVCVGRPYVATVSADRSVRMWNYLTWECEVSYDAGAAGASGAPGATDEPTAVALHPSGFFALVTFKEGVTLFNVLKDTLREFRHMALKNVRNVQFSPGGNLFALSYGISLEIYETHTFAPFRSLSGHIRPVRDLYWSDVSTLHSVGMDGSMFTWNAGASLVNIAKQRGGDASRPSSPASASREIVKIDQITLAPNMFVAVAVDRKRPMAICASTTGELFDVRRLGSGDVVSMGRFPITTRAHDKASVTVTCMRISHGNNALLCGTSAGCVRVYPWPLVNGKDAVGPDMEAERFTECVVHNGAVTGIEISFDDKFLFTSGEDGCIFSLEMVQMVNGVEMKTSSAAPIASAKHFNLEAIVVSKEDIDEKIARIANLTKDMSELRSDTEYSLHVKDAEWGDQLKSKAEEMDMALTMERERYESLQQRHEAFVREHMEELDKRDNDHIKSTQRMENTYEHKMAIEITRYDEVSDAMERQAQHMRTELERLGSNQKARLAELEQQREQEVASLQEKISSLEQQIEVNEHRAHEIMEQTEHENAMEIQKWKQRNQAHVKRAKDEERYLKAQLHKQTDTCQKLRDKMEKIGKVQLERDNQYEVLKQQYATLKVKLSGAENDKDDMQVSLQQKERDILGLKSKQSTLENFKYVLNHRIQMLSKEKGPIAEHIGALEKHIREMYRELVVEFNIKKDTTRQLDDALMKLKGQAGDMRTLTNKLRKAENEISSIQGGLFNLVKYTDPKDFEAATRDLYRQFVKKEKGGRAPSKASKKRAPAEEKKESAGADETAGGNGDGPSHSGGQGQGRGSVSMGDGAAKEAARQRDYMERTVHTLKKTLRLAGDRMQRKSKMSMNENTVLINECNMLRRENHRFRQRVAEMESTIRGLENKVRGPPGSRGSMGVGRGGVGGGILSPQLSMGSVTGGSNREGPPGSGWGRKATPSIDPRDLMASRGGMSTAGGSRTDDAVQPGGSAVLAGIQEGSTSDTSGSVQLPRPESQAQRMRREVSTASAGGSQRISTTLRSVSTASLGGSGVHNRPGRSRGKIPGKVIRGSTRPIMEAATTRSKVQGMLNELDDNNRLIEMQRIEIGRLREQVQLMVNNDHNGGMMMGIDGDGEIGPGGIVVVHTEGGLGEGRPESRGAMVGGQGNGEQMPPAYVMGQSQSQPHLEQRF